MPDVKFQESPVKRAIRPLGTALRVVLGAYLLGSVIYGHFIKGPFRPLPWVVGLLIFPATFTAWQYVRARRHPERLVADSPLATVLNIIIFAVFYFTYWYAPPAAFLSDAVLIFYGLSMLVAALRGYAGCESLAISNWLLHRDDQIGCLLFSPIDAAEAKLAAPSNR